MKPFTTYNIMIAVLIAGTALFSSCDKKEITVKDLMIKGLPTLSARNVETMYSDSGKVTMVVQTPLIQQYSSEENPYTLFPKGLTVLFYDRTDKPQASITSNYARYTEKDDVWELRDSVVAVSNKGEVLETELLFWSQPRDRIWSDRFVRFTHNDQIVMGTGFNSDSRFSNWTIKNVTGTIYIRDEQEVTPAD
ncbi:MAG TPA: LPS export ABC transporter periplasmic protein LptC [Bacteroidales bacterium]|nr:LPS export ABC transporter periplasmic protein LptC [Bacteroidales bacterium]OPZ55796.1 MAG: Lipopolysaccharide-assembly, LptC-related [Bacteroidetes bacterium ADurb.BinA012]HNY58181.1 LPS export ABC transporter periplasmic protein LptC [Bacteroidales bacterium]HOC05238.1 LPS export ABC transporter periplasmic protein LptC [Bacteroidales bacterium]HOT17674.1 LPS export ABC transporter periplasmic protein LptC [Bacteroidales bacterium]